jgi:polysaccharide export outer membrane protein
MRVGRAIAIGGLVLLARCGALPPLPKAAMADYRLGAGDQVRIVTYGDERLSGTFRVGDNGKIDMPLLGSVMARGDTSDGLAASIAAALRSHQLMQNPSVSAEIVAYRPVFILGEVAHPGRYPYEPGMTMLTVVAIAGGFTYRAQRDDMEVERTAEQGVVQGIAPSTAEVEPGDVITVRERYF